MKKFSEYVIENTVVNEGSWDDTEAANEEIFETLKRAGFKVKKTSVNGLNIMSKNGIVGHVVFDPTYKF